MRNQAAEHGQTAPLSDAVRTCRGMDASPLTHDDRRLAYEVIPTGAETMVSGHVLQGTRSRAPSITNAPKNMVKGFEGPRVRSAASVR